MRALRPAETPVQRQCREWWTARLGASTVGWGRDKNGVFLTEFARNAEAAWVAARATAPEAAKLLSVIERIKFRLHFVGWPAEAFWSTGHAWTPDWRYEIALIENALHGSPIDAPEKPTDTRPWHEIKPAASSAVLDDYRTHHDDFRVACLVAQAHSKSESDRSYWQHQVDVLDRIKPAASSAADDAELPGMWSHSDFTGGATDAAEQEQAGEPKRRINHCMLCGGECKGHQA